MPNTTWTAGQRITAQALNDMFPSSIQVRNGSFSLSSSASVYTAISFSSIASATNTSMWSGGTPTRLIAPSAGTYQVHGFITWPGTLSSADGRAEFRLNGSGSASPDARNSTARGSAGNLATTISGLLIFGAAGEYAELYANQNSGSSTSLIVSAGMTRVSYSTS